MSQNDYIGHRQPTVLWTKVLGINMRRIAAIIAATALSLAAFAAPTGAAVRAWELNRKSSVSSTASGWRRVAAALLVAALTAALTSVMPGVAHAVPANDDFEDAELVVTERIGCTRAATITDRSLAVATAQPREPHHEGAPALQSIWFTLNIPDAGTVYLRANFGPRFSIYRGDSLATLVPVEDDGASSYRLFEATAGDQVHVAVDVGQPGVQLEYLRVRLPYVADNDTAASAMTISGRRGRIPACGGPEGADGTSVGWYRWTAPEAGFESFGIGWDSKTAVYKGQPGSLALVARAFAPEPGEYADEDFRRYTDFWAKRGTTYYIKAAVGLDRFESLGETLTWRPGTDYPNPRADFDRDGCEDLVVGAPGEDVGPAANAGVVVVKYGCRSEIDRWHQGNDGLGSSLESGDGFGHAVAAGDFDRDGYADLAVGAPSEDEGSRRDVGAVTVLRGSADGLTSTGAFSIRQSAASGPLSANEAGDRFGYSLAARELEASYLTSAPEHELPAPPATLPADLVVGVPGEDHGGKRNAGTVAMFDGEQVTSPIEHGFTMQSPFPVRAGALLGSSLASGGLVEVGMEERMWIAGQPGARIDGKDAAGSIVYMRYDAGGPIIIDGVDYTSDFSSVRAGDRMGTAVAIADIHDDENSWLVVGLPGRDVNGVPNAGMVAVLSISSAKKTKLLTQASPGFPGRPQPGDRFGAALATGFFDTDTKQDIVIGAPGDVVNGRDNAGTITLRYGDGRSRGLHLDSPGMKGVARAGDQLGAAVGGIDINGDTVDEVAAGAPRDDVGGATDAGSVVVWRRNNTSTFHSAGMTPSGVESGDRFGAALVQ